MISQFLLNRDAFGYQVNLKVRGGNGQEQTSKVGGLVSLMVYMFMGVFFYIKGDKMVEGNLDNIMQTEQVVNFTEIGNVSLTGMMPII